MFRPSMSYRSPAEKFCIATGPNHKSYLKFNNLSIETVEVKMYEGV